MKIIEGGLRVAASDVANFLACQQLTQLDLGAARGALRGEEHERCSSGSALRGTRSG
jgi:hypothetical protein